MMNAHERLTAAAKSVLCQAWGMDLSVVEEGWASLHDMGVPQFFAEEIRRRKQT